MVSYDDGSIYITGASGLGAISGPSAPSAFFCGAVCPFAIAWDRVAFCIEQKAHQGLELRFTMNDRPSF